MKNKFFVFALTVGFITSALLSGCKFNIDLGVPTNIITYENDENYSSGSADLNDNISELNINWISGRVEVNLSNDSAVHINEYENKYPEEALQLHYWLDGSVLNVLPCASGSSYPEKLRKTLSVSLPEECLSAVSVNSVSAEIKISELEADDLTISTVSGISELENCKITDLLKMNGTSASLSADLNGKLTELEFNSVSGAAKISASEIESAKLTTTSGAVKLTLDRQPKELSHTSTSGSIMLTLPENSDFIAEFGTTSGDFKCELPFKKDRKSYIVGNGGDRYSIKTTSGNVSIKRK